MGRLLCQLYRDVFINHDYTGLHRMVRSQGEVARRMMEARRIGQAESERHRQETGEDEYEFSDVEEGDEEEGDGENETDEAASGVAGLSISGGSNAAASSSSSTVRSRNDPIEEKTEEQLQLESEGWETVPKRGRKGGRK